MLKKRIIAIVLCAVMAVAFAVPAAAYTPTSRAEGRNADIVQNNRCYINGDEINAYQVDGTVYVVADDLAGYGFDVDEDYNITWEGGYEFDESYMPTTENAGYATGTVAESGKGTVKGEEVALYTIDGDICVKAEDLGKFGYVEVDAEKNMYNIYVTDAGYAENEEGFRNITVDAGEVTDTFKKILGEHYDPQDPGTDTNNLYLEIGVDGLRTHDIDGTSGDGRGIIYNIVPGYFDTIKAIWLLKELKAQDGEFKDPEDPVLVNLYPASRLNAELDKVVAAGLVTDKTGNYDEQIASLEEALAAIDLRSEEEYDFTETDKVIERGLGLGADIMFRFGASQNDIIDNTFPTVGTDAWTTYVNNLGIIAEQIVKHYQKGWADGFENALTYFEIWNEADLLDFWPNTLNSGAQAYYEMYDVVGKAAKNVDPDLPVGGPTVTTHNDDRGLVNGFLDYVKANGSPLDFWSFHYYPSVNADPYDYARWANMYENILSEYGYDIPLFLSEYGTNIFGNPFTMSANAQNTFHTAALIYMQQSVMERAYSYGRPVGRNGSMSSTYYGYKALSNFQDTNQILETTGNDKNGMAVLAGTNDSKDKINVLIANYEMPASQMLSNATDESHNPIISDGKLIPPNQVAAWSLPYARVMTYKNNAGYNLTINNVPFEGVSNVNIEIYRKSVDDDYVLIDTVKAPIVNGTVTLSKELGIYAYDMISITPRANRAMGRTADIIQNSRAFINGNEIRAFQIDGTIYMAADDLKGYGFSVSDAYAIDWVGGYEFDESYMPTTESWGMEAGTISGTLSGKVKGEDVTIYTIDGLNCVKASDLEVFGYSKYDADKNMYNLYVTAAGYKENEDGYRELVVDADDVTGSFKKILGEHYDPGDPGTDTNNLYLEIGVDGLRTHDIDGTSGDGRGIIYNIVPGYFDTIKAIWLLKELKAQGGEFKDPEDPVLVNLYPASRLNAELDKVVAAGLVTDKTGNYDEQIADLETKLAAIDLRSEDAYDFEETDKVIERGLGLGADIMFRFGASQNDIIDNTFPTVGTDEWTTYVNNLGIIAEQIVKHYQQGWADGFDNALTYFEIWNEADLLDFWPNTLNSGAQAYYEMYDVVGKAAKRADPSLPVGGPTVTTHNDDRGLVNGFLDYVKANGSPLDFWSFHYYPSVNADPYDYARWANMYKNILDDYGYDIPLFLSEYGTNIFGNPFTMDANAQNTFHTAALIYMQQSVMERAYSYGRPAGRNGNMSSTYYGYKALANFQKTNNILGTTGNDKNGMAVLAGINDSKDEINVLVANYEMPASQMLSNATDESHNPIISDGKLIPPNKVAAWSLPEARVMTYENNDGYNLTIKNVPFTSQYVTVEQYRIDNDNKYALVATTSATVENGELKLSKGLTAYKVDLLKIKAVSAEDAAEVAEAEAKAAAENVAAAEKALDDAKAALEEAKKSGEAEAIAAAEKEVANAEAELKSAQNIAKETKAAAALARAKADLEAAKAAAETDSAKIAELQKQLQDAKAALVRAQKAPAKVKIAKVTAKKKALAIKWKKVADANGYEIMIAANKKFTKNVKTITIKKGTTVSKTIKKLKGKTKYFVKVRAFKNLSGGKAYGKWSAVKNKKTK